MAATTHAQKSMSVIMQAIALTNRFAFATEAGLAESTIRKIGTDEWNPKFLVLVACEAAAKRIIADWRKRHGGQG